MNRLWKAQINAQVLGHTVLGATRHQRCIASGPNVAKPGASIDFTEGWPKMWRINGVSRATFSEVMGVRQ